MLPARWDGDGSGACDEKVKEWLNLLVLPKLCEASLSYVVTEKPLSMHENICKPE